MGLYSPLRPVECCGLFSFLDPWRGASFGVSERMTRLVWHGRSSAQFFARTAACIEAYLRPHDPMRCKRMQPGNDRKNLPPEKRQRGPQRNLPTLAQSKPGLGAEPGEQGQGKS